MKETWNLNETWAFALSILIWFLKLAVGRNLLRDMIHGISKSIYFGQWFGLSFLYEHFMHICLCLMSRWAERSVEVWILRCDYHSFAPMNPSGFTCWLCPSLALLCLSALFSAVDNIHPANPFPYKCYLRVTKMTFVSPPQCQTHYPCIKPDWEQVFFSLISSALYNHNLTGAILNSLAKYTSTVKILT